ncbi:MAG: L-lysine 6-transaminase [Anaerolineae bacterium]|nr:MAG: L-lysine 6-transaminase [Anaerolineae bacterium]
MKSAMNPQDVHATIKKYMLGDGEALVLDLAKSHGAYIHDALSGRDFIDFFTFYGSQPVGYNHPKMQDDAFKEALLEAAQIKPSSSDFYTTHMARFVETFGRVAMPEGFHHLFLISGGALAVENALKTAFDWKVRKNFKRIQDNPDAAQKMYIEGFGTQIIHFKEAFHGRSGYTLSLTNTDDPRKYMYFPKFNWPRIETPKLRFPVTDDVLAQVTRIEDIALAQIESAVRQFRGDVAALIIEPIQGEGGDNHFRDEFFQALRDMANKHEFLFIVDEVQSGMGITGKMWAMEHTPVMPDLIAFGKKAQVCGVIAGPRLKEVKNHVFEESSRINSTWGGNLVDMVRSTRYLEIIEEEKLLQHAARVGQKMIDGLEQIAEESKGVMTNVRGKGFMIAYDLPSREVRNDVLHKLSDHGLKALKSGPHSVRFRGMLDTPEDVVDKALEIVAQTVPVG